MTYICSKTIWNKLDEAHGLIITYPEFDVKLCKNDEDGMGIHYEIYADGYLDYVLGVCDALDIEVEWDFLEFDLYKLHIYLKDE